MDSLPPPVPKVPQQSSVASRRQRSLPALDQRRKKQPTNNNNITMQPASPQVISSLIDSLSAISGPAHDHFENFPSINGGSVSVSETPSPLLPKSTDSVYSATNSYFGVDTASQRSSREAPNIYLDDAAEPPVIRTSRAPSGLSPLTAPKQPKKERQNSFRGYLSSAAQSSTSLISIRSGKDRDDASSIGGLSLDGGLKAEGRTSAESKRSARGHRSLLYMSSRERLRNKENEKKRMTMPKFGWGASSPPEDAHHLSPPAEPTHQPPSPPAEFLAENAIYEGQEEPAATEPSRLLKIDTKGKSPMRDGASRGEEDRSSPTGSSPGFIPERQSSLKHLASPYKKSNSQRSSRSNRFRTKTVIEEEEGSEGNRDKDEFDGVESQTTKRIRELKKQKELREKTHMNGEQHAGERSHVSPMATPPSPPTSSDSGLSERRPHDIKSKAHKLLGLSSLAGASSTLVKRSQASASLDQQQQQHQQLPPPPKPPTAQVQSSSLPVKEPERKRDDAHDDGPDEPIPLPINYQLALQTLERQTSPESTRPAQALRTSSTTPGKIKPSATVVGSRSVSAAATTATVTPHRKHHTSMARSSSTSSPGGSSLHQQRSASPAPDSHSDAFRQYHQRTRSQTLDRHQSLQVAPPPARSTTDARSKKKSRWSHPDLPSKAVEQSDTVSRRDSRDSHSHSHSHAVKPPSLLVKEDRPSSADSIDVEVESFLDSPRLSQRMRHPQNGRVISFSEVGDPRGFAVFCCVGMGLTRYVMAFYGELASTLKLRLITPDRPGIGGSQGDDTVTPLTWTDDILAICQKLKITKFSLLAHSAGAVYALAAALRMPQHIRGRVHLLAPWIPPSQMAPIGVRQADAGGRQLPRSQRILRALPPSLLKIANSSFLSTTSASITRSSKSQPTKRKSIVASATQPTSRPTMAPHRDSMMLMDLVQPNSSALSLSFRNATDPRQDLGVKPLVMGGADQHRRAVYDERLTFAIWERATTHANPAADLVVCLETKHTIGFRYEDITRGVVIHHGSKDTRVPVDNVRWLGRIMRRCEVRILEGEAHGLMANPMVMSNLLMEIAKEWEDWTTVVEGSRDRKGSPLQI